eukprot:2321009-Pleurochrysis_carterae.AAC.1
MPQLYTRRGGAQLEGSSRAGSHLCLAAGRQAIHSDSPCAMRFRAARQERGRSQTSGQSWSLRAEPKE